MTPAERARVRIAVRLHKLTPAQLAAVEAIVLGLAARNVQTRRGERGRDA